MRNAKQGNHLKRIQPFLNREDLVTVYRSIVEPYFSYCCIVWDTISETLATNLQKLQHRAARIIITGAPHTKQSHHILQDLGFSTPAEMRQKQKAVMMFKIIKGFAPAYLSEMFTFSADLNDYYTETTEVVTTLRLSDPFCGRQSRFVR